jgi:hypothetical protein
MLRSILLLALLAAAFARLEAAPPDPRPGHYVRERDTGTLTVRRGEQNRHIFEIESIGGNCHSCSVTGVLRGTIGHGDSWAGDASDSKCDISFSSSPSGIVVSPMSQENCRAYCGARAGFDGIYRIPPTTCTSEGRQAQRERFLHLYRSRRYPLATKTLQTLIAQCREFIGWIEMDQIRNDLALSQYHSGHISQCLGTLNETLAARAKDEEELKAGTSSVHLPPCDFDNYIEVAKSTWFNRTLCTKAMSRER